MHEARSEGPPLVAPFAGWLGIRKADVGQHASVGMSLITLPQLDPIYVDFPPMPEQALVALNDGKEVDVKLDAIRARGFAAGSPSSTPASPRKNRSVMVRALLDNDDKRLLPGMQVYSRCYEGLEFPKRQMCYALSFSRSARFFS